ncbi:transglycosylase domain-containing protein [Metabacillus schmidteae]|uniref:transglycosylase domain-containing protein n=1 Tax=Metabacillus schmidteae TaxID=2730405 RepID=UPI00158CD36C|nr:transglycosylase domain-containing protein [Metabacillus schmidteae]
MKKKEEKHRRFSPFNKDIAKSLRISYNVIGNLLLLFLIIGLIGLCFAGGVGAGYFASLVKDEPVRSYEDMKNDIYNYEETSQIFFDQNIYLGKLNADIEREEVQLENVSQHVIDAVIATEDELFYEHDGVVPKAIMRALFQEFTNASVQTGGSTLTQQLIKNQILTNEVSFDRKAKEILLALRLEKFFEKEEIIEAYLNVADFGRNSNGKNIAGVEAAAKGIFGVTAKDLSIPQAAFIAGLPQSPFGYTPFSNDGGKVKEDINAGINRMKTVLNRMYTGGFITKEQYEQALSYDIRANLTPKKPTSTDQYPYLTYEVEDRAKDIIAIQLAEKDGYKEEEVKKDNDLYYQYRQLADEDIRHNGYRIHTTINKDIYDKMQDVAKQYEYYGSDKPEEVKDSDTGEMKTVQEPVEVGGILIENTTGKIISFVGGRDFERENLNHATDAPRSNWSSMKPLLVYAPAMELGQVQPGTVIADTPITSGYNPKNYGGAYHGLTSARTALKYSYNVPAAKTYKNIMSKNPVSYLEKMGFTNLNKIDYEIASLSLGGMTDGVTVEENVNAYATFANQGKFVDAFLIEKIENSDGDIVYQHEKVQNDVFSAQTAYLTIDMMRDVIRSGTAASLNSYLSFSADWAGKTGTGQDYTDAWFVATNPNVTFGTWIGYDTPKPLQQNYKGISYSKRNLLLWAKLMNAAHDAEPNLIAPKNRFETPGGIVQRSYCALTGELASDLCRQAGLVATDIFNAKYVPTKVDDSLTRGKYVYVKDRAYKVPSSAPSEFVQEGVMLKKEVLDRYNISSTSDLKRLLPNTSKWGNLVVTEGKGITDNGSKPRQVNGVSSRGSNISWKANSDNDVVGYRVYGAANHSTNFKKVASLPSSDKLSVSVGNNPAAYYIVAVDVGGNESSPSAIIKIGDYAEQKPKTEEPKQEENADQNKEQKNKNTDQNKEQKNKNTDQKPKQEEAPASSADDNKAP